MAHLGVREGGGGSSSRSPPPPAGSSGRPPRPPSRPTRSILILESVDYKKKEEERSAAAVLAEERVDLVECKAELDFDRLEMEKQVARDQREMRKLSEEIRPASKRNFELEKNLAVIDKQIQRLIQNIISIAQLDDLAGGVLSDTKMAVGRSPLDGKKANYEKLFHVLQKKPHYLASVASEVEVRDIQDFVKTVVFDLYGDQYDNREERLLLTLFQEVLQKTFDEALDIGSFMRSNTAITQMLSAYARRGQGLGILRDILEKPIREMVGQSSLNLEINPVEVYRQIIDSYEKKTGRTWDGPRNPSADEAADNKYVKRLIPPRIKQLEFISEYFLSRIIETVDQVPFGIRWICKQLAEMAQNRFPDADRYQIGGLVGGYIYLRFFNPVIVTPESVHFVDKKLSKTMRRNLILVAKILQNLSNGVQFRDKYMHELNGWVDRHREDIQTYFARLIDVDDLEDRMDVDNLLERVRERDYTIQISFNQIFLIHRLLNKHKSVWMPSTKKAASVTADPVVLVLATLGSAPTALKHKDNHSINLRLTDEIVSSSSGTSGKKGGGPPPPSSRSKSTSSTGEGSGGDTFDASASAFMASTASKDPFILSLRARLKQLMLSDTIPEELIYKFRNSLHAWLNAAAEHALLSSDTRTTNAVEFVMSGLTKYCKKIGESDTSQGFNNFLMVYVSEIRELKKRADRFHAKVVAVSRARDTIIDHSEYLGQKLQYYQKYLENVMESGAVGKGGLAGAKSSKSSSVKTKPVKMTHMKLKELGVILDVDADILRRTKANVKNLIYYFNRVSADKYTCEVKYKVGFGAKISPFPKPFQISFTSLLQMRDEGSMRYNLEMVTLSVPELIQLINTEFIAKGD